MTTLENVRLHPADQVNQAIDACAKQCAEAAQQCCNAAKQCVDVAQDAKRTFVARVVDFLVWLNAAISSEGPAFAVYEDRRKYDVEAQQRILRAALYHRR